MNVSTKFRLLTFTCVAAPLASNVVADAEQPAMMTKP